MLEVNALTKRYVAVEGVGGGVSNASFSLEPGTFFTLLGPSGCGKTTTLRCIAGLERPDHGTISIGERTVFDAGRHLSVPVHRRGIGMVFQSYAIWPHLSVFENVAFPLRVAREHRYSKPDIGSRVEAALKTVGLGSYGQRSSTRLSGGQQQRVALARAIVAEPKLLLLDEPLSNLDASLREGMRQELKRLQRQLGLTTVYVTHDQAEALAISDRIAVLDNGTIVQLGTPNEIYFRPRNAFVAGFVGAANLLRGRVEADTAAERVGAVRLNGGATLACLFVAAAQAGAEIAIALRPEWIAVAANGGGANRFDGTVTSLSFLGATNRCEVIAADLKLLVDLPADAAVAVGQAVTLSTAAEHCLAIPL
ncbi:MAG: ABC transporter ATP-binding protein [Xanthobacteraceae bacterium]